MHARLQQYHRRLIQFGDHRRFAVYSHIHRPVALVTRQGHPALAVDGEALAEASALLVSLQEQFTRPDATAGLLVIVHRAVALRMFLQNPFRPGLQRARNLIRGEGFGDGLGQPEQGENQSQYAHR